MNIQNFKKGFVTTSILWEVYIALVLVIASLAAGGGERVISALANHLYGSHAVTIITIAEANSTLFYRINEVKVLGLGYSIKKGVIPFG